MDIYTNTYICEGCTQAVFHDCCGEFCHCKGDYTDDVNYIDGECERKEQD